VKIKTILFKRIIFFLILPLIGISAKGNTVLELNPGEEKVQRAAMIEMDIRIRNIASMLSLRNGAGLYYNFRKLARIDIERPNDFKKTYTGLYQKWEENDLAKYMNNVKTFAESGRKYLSDIYNTESKIEWNKVENEYRNIINECRNCHAGVGL